MWPRFGPSIGSIPISAIFKTMIYTVGNTENYERFFSEQRNPRKAIGGSVWQTKEEAAKHIGWTHSVFGVDADWEKDTIKKGDHSWNDLLIEANLIRL